MEFLPVQYSWLSHAEAYTLHDRQHTPHQALQILLALWGHSSDNMYC